MKRVVLVSLEHVGAAMAGPGIRYYNFARELAKAHEVTLVVPNEDTGTVEGVEVVPRPSLSRRALRELCLGADAVVAQHLTVDLMRRLADSPVRAIYDLYVPFATENLALHASGRRRYSDYAYRAGNLHQREALANGNSFLCASERQRDLWLGALAAAGRVELDAYERDPSLRDLIDVVPFGLDPAPPEPTRPVVKGAVDGIAEQDKVLLWGGGIWNWFDPLTPIRAAERLARRRDDVKLFFLGVRHPNPGVPEMARASEAMALADSLGLTGKFVFFNHGWVPYHERHAYFREADLGISAHFDTVETRFAFRTRLLDHFAAGLPSLVTGGDVLGDLVAVRGAGRTVGVGDVDGWVEAIESLLDDDNAYTAAVAATAPLREELAWPAVVRPLLRLVELPGEAVATRSGPDALLRAWALTAGQAVTNPRLAVEVARRRWR